MKNSQAFVVNQQENDIIWRDKRYVRGAPCLVITHKVRHDGGGIMVKVWIAAARTAGWVRIKGLQAITEKWFTIKLENYSKYGAKAEL